MGKHRNRLADEPSLYLRQHGANPVDWYPWSKEALERARTEDRPILLSIGYSSCHWCHVMERESFENEDIARLMNERFVCIKVDREERPDLDNIYMKAVQMMTGHGGWPMTVFLAPDLRPYYAGTYFPPEDRGGMPGFPRVLAGAHRAFVEQGDKVRESGQRIAELLAAEPGRQPGELTSESLLDAGRRLTTLMDESWGGFGSQPKFPGTMSLVFLMGLDRFGADDARSGLVRTALDRMAAGGIHDQLGGGFHRYSVDRYWLVPHFEKMLYDQALLADCYTEAALVFDEPAYGRVAGGIADYLLAEMRSADGPFFATQDADSEGEEGKFFVWTPDEVRAVVGEQDHELVCRYFDVSEEGNFEGKNVLRTLVTLEETARMFGLDTGEAAGRIERARRLMLAARSTRVPPATDQKFLVDWNGLMVSALARTGVVLGRDDLVEAARGAADHILAHMYRDGRLLRFSAQGQARVEGFLDDYAFFGRACLELFHALSGQDARPYLEAAMAMADTVVTDFEDSERGGFRFTAAHHEDLLVRTRELQDSAVPAGSSVAIELLLRLFVLTGKDDYRWAGRAALEGALAGGLDAPYGAGHLLTVATRELAGYATVVVSGPESEAAERLIRVVTRGKQREVCLVRVKGADDWLPEPVRSKNVDGGEAAAWVCRAMSCMPAAMTEDELSERLRTG